MLIVLTVGGAGVLEVSSSWIASATGGLGAASVVLGALARLRLARL